MSVLAMTVLLLLGSLMAIAILLQRGRGGGVAGAFGRGGHSVVGTRAGDVFTWITVGLAVAWVAVAIGCGVLLQSQSSLYS
jgi:preprotein translocase subunit SecG